MESCRKLKFGVTDTWYKYKLEYVQENATYKILLNKWMQQSGTKGKITLGTTKLQMGSTCNSASE